MTVCSNGYLEGECPHCYEVVEFTLSPNTLSVEEYEKLCNEGGEGFVEFVCPKCKRSHTVEFLGNRK